MSTIIYPSPIFGPVHSRRLGLSLGINLMPADGKVCTFNCIYCECGLNEQRRPTQPRPTREEVARALETTLQRMAADGQRPDVLTFAGNGEPTCHPDFAAIIDDTIRLRDRYCPEARVSVLSNATQLHRRDVFEALLRVDNNIQKLDTVDMDFIRRVDQPVSPRYDVQQVVEQLRQFRGHVIIQTMFLHINELRITNYELRAANDELRAANDELRTANDDKIQPLETETRRAEVEIRNSELKGRNSEFGIRNTESHFVLPWLEAVKRIQPQQVMIYTIDRETPVGGLSKATPDELNRIRDLVLAAGIPCTASY